MAKEQILIVDDEEDLLDRLRHYLSREGYQVSCAISSEQALAKVNKGSPDLILLELMIPSIGGLEVCRQLKTNPTTRNVPIIMLSFKSEEADIVNSLEAGADDYVTKPFSPRVLLAKVRVLLRRKIVLHAQEDQVIRIQGLEINSARHEAASRRERIKLSPSELRMLQLLARSPGRVFTRKGMISSLRGDHYPVTDRSVDVAISALREKLGELGN
jgi:DNA-binding response OmpR family regulator